MLRYFILATLAIAGTTTVPAPALPASYTRSVQRYPVLYLTDAQWQFDQTRATAAFLARNGLIPEMIIVAVTNTKKKATAFFDGS